MKIYIASSEKHVGKIQEDIYLQNTFLNKGFSCEITTLEKIVHITKPYDLVILKSIWGYHLEYKEFLKKLKYLKKKKVNLINEYDFIFWNIDKYKYLSEIKCLNVIPTTLIKLKNFVSETEIQKKIISLSKKINTDLVIKPRVSASGYLTFKFDKDEDNRGIIKLLKNKSDIDFIAQPYRPDIKWGELSIILINGSIMYGIKRFPGIFIEKKDTEYVEIQKIPKKIKKQIKLLKGFLSNKFKVSPNICRVDFVKNSLDYEIMEIELIDPDLFFRYIPNEMLAKCLNKITSIKNNKI